MRTITFQEAERRILRDGEPAFALSQEEDGVEATSVPLALTLNNTLNTSPNNNATNHGNMAETSPHLEITSLEGVILVFSPPRLFTLKIPAKNIC